MCHSLCTAQRTSLGYRATKVKWEIPLHHDLSSNIYTCNVWKFLFLHLPIYKLWDGIFLVTREIEQLFIYLTFRFPLLWIRFLIYFAHFGVFVFFLLNCENFFNILNTNTCWLYVLQISSSCIWLAFIMFKVFRCCI